MLTVSSGPRAANVVRAAGPCDNPALRVARRLKTGRVPVSVAAGDFNGDGQRDLVVANSGSDNVSVYLGDGKGGFSDAINFAVGSSPRAVAVGDFNSDGHADIVVTNYGANSVSLLAGDGQGRFTSVATLPVGTSPVAVALAD